MVRGGPEDFVHNCTQTIFIPNDRELNFKDGDSFLFRANKGTNSKMWYYRLTPTMSDPIFLYLISTNIFIFQQIST